MKEMNKEMELNMNELAQVNGGVDTDTSCSFYAVFPDDEPNNLYYCEAGVAPIPHLVYDPTTGTFVIEYI